MSGPFTREHDCDHCRHWRLDPAEIGEMARAARVLASLPGLLTEARTLRGLSQREVARQTGVSFSTVSRIERGVTETTDIKTALALMAWIEGFGLPALPGPDPNGDQP